MLVTIYSEKERKMYTVNMKGDDNDYMGKIEKKKCVYKNEEKP